MKHQAQPIEVQYGVNKRNAWSCSALPDMVRAIHASSTFNGSEDRFRLRAVQRKRLGGVNVTGAKPRHDALNRRTSSFSDLLRSRSLKGILSEVLALAAARYGSRLSALLRRE